MLEVQKHAVDLHQQAAIVQAEQERLENELDALMTDRQWVITQVRQGTITTEDMEYQSSALTLRELTLKREMMSIREAARLSALDDWKDVGRGLPRPSARRNGGTRHRA